jgi:single-stranded-DNA-specific exonuclease
MEIGFDSVNSDLIDDIKKIEPFGKKNEVPVFLTKNLEVKSAETLKEGKHLRLLLSLDNQTRKGIWFNYSKDILEGQKADILLNKKVNVVYTIQKDTYKGNTNITLMIRDITTA